MENKKKEVLSKVGKDNLELIKYEAEAFIEAQSASEDILLNKSNNFFQLLLAITISIAGYCISEATPKPLVLKCAFELLLFFTISLLILLILIFPRKIYLKGTSPSNILYEDIFSGSPFDGDKLLKNRIISLDSDIQKNKIKQYRRATLFKLSIIITLLGVLIVVFNVVFLQDHHRFLFLHEALKCLFQVCK